MDTLLPLFLYVGCALGAVGVAIALPRRGVSFAFVGGVIAAAAGGLIVLGLSLRAWDDGELPNIFFYAFAAMALGGSLRMITHPRPVYAALYFILTIVASSGMYLLLSAEFMAFALIIIYAGAILITYLFVIMLATQSPDEENPDKLSEYDAIAREPIAGTVVGFVLLAVLSTMMLRGTTGETAVEPRPLLAEKAQVLAELPRKTERAWLDELKERGLMSTDAEFVRELPPKSDRVVGERLVIDGDERTILTVASDERTGRQIIETVRVPDDLWDDVNATNPEAVGLNLLGDHPMTIEIAGVILLMAMLGATVLSRKQVDLEEEEKAKQDRLLRDRRLSVRGDG